MVCDRYAVVGNPIAHSKSPFIHQFFAQQLQQNLSYETLLIEQSINETADQVFKRVLTDLFKQGHKGFNVTVPYKQAAFELAQIKTARAQSAGAVNTLWMNTQQQIVGDNTDGCGLVRDLTERYQRKITGRSLLILGAGGAVRGVLEPLLTLSPSRCVIVNRSLLKAQELAQQFEALAQQYLPTKHIETMEYPQLAGHTFDLVINGTSASLQGSLPPLPEQLFTPNGWAYDMMYGAHPTPFMQWALFHEAARALDGLGMLVEQAAEAFYLWRGIRPDTDAVLAAVRTLLRNSAPLETPIEMPVEIDGFQGRPEPTRFGDWEHKGRCIDY